MIQQLFCPGLHNGKVFSHISVTAYGVVLHTKCTVYCSNKGIDVSMIQESNIEFHVDPSMPILLQYSVHFV